MMPRELRYRFFFMVLLCIASAIPLYSSPREDSVPVAAGPRRIGDRLIFNFEGYSYELNLRNLSCTFIDAANGEKAVVSNAAFPGTAYRIDEGLSKILYPTRGLTVRVGREGDALLLSISSENPSTIRWPSLAMVKEGTALIWPWFEGSYIPLDDRVWTDFLTSRKWNTTERLYLPFWGIENGRRLLSYIVENPFHNEIKFTERGKTIRMDFAHTFPANADLIAPITFRIYADNDVTPIAPAKHFRKYLEDRNALVTIQDKMKIAPPVSRLIGASHAYVWGGDPITIADVRTDCWIPLAEAIVDQAAAEGPSAGVQIMTAASDEAEVISAMSRETTPAPYLQRGMADALSGVLRSPRLYDADVWPPTSLPPGPRKTAERILAGEDIDEREVVRLNGILLHTSFPAYVYEPSTWGNGVSTRMIDALSRNGMDRFVLTCNGIENIDIRPGIASYAAEKGYLIGPYDGYDNVQDPDAPEWPTAVFDRALYETGGIVGADGTPVRGFLGVGRSASPIATKPYFDARTSENFRHVPSSYYFLDGDAFGEFFDDYRPDRTVAASTDAAARVDRVRSIFENHKVPVGSEGGSYLFASSLAVAEGVFFPVLTGDRDMEVNEMSRYFLGRPFPKDESERFFMPTLLKEKYVRLYGDPRFRLPLYEAVFHDSVVTTSHYSSPSLKFTNMAQTVALTEILYQVAPMYHFNLSSFEKIKGTIKPHVDAFKKTHSYSYRFALEDFAFLTEDRRVQKTRFGNLELIANFGETPFELEGRAIPARSLRATFIDSGESTIYNAQESAQIEGGLGVAGANGSAEAANIPSLIEALQDEEWEVRAAAAKALANTEVPATEALPALMRVLRDEEWQVRRPAAYALATFGKAAKAAVPLLIEALDDEEWHVRRAAASALGAVASGSAKVDRALKAKLADPELQVRTAAERALRAIRERRIFGWRILFK